MTRNLRNSIIAQMGICLVIFFIQSNSLNLFSQIITAFISITLYLIIGFNLNDLGSRVKNLLSVSATSLISILLAGICCSIYQFEVIYKYHYTFEPFYYTLSRVICFAFNAPVLPFARALAYFNKSFDLPYGLLISFFIPTLLLWVGIELKTRKAAKIEY